MKEWAFSRIPELQRLLLGEEHGFAEPRGLEYTYFTRWQHSSIVVGGSSDMSEVSNCSSDPEPAAIVFIFWILVVLVHPESLDA